MNIQDKQPLAIVYCFHKKEQKIKDNILHVIFHFLEGSMCLSIKVVNLDHGLPCLEWPICLASTTPQTCTS